MPEHEIKPSQHTDDPITIYLKLDSHGKLINPETTEVFQRGEVVWQIKDANIQSFRIRGKFLAHHHPFTVRPSHHVNPTLNLHVRDDAHHDWKYKIIYIKTDHTKHTLDPKIAVKSQPILTEEFTFAFPLILAIVTLKTSNFFQKIKLQIEKSARDHKRKFS